MRSDRARTGGAVAGAALIAAALAGCAASGTATASTSVSAPVSVSSASPSPSVISLPTPTVPATSAPAAAAAPTTVKAVPTTPAPSGSVCPVKEKNLIHIDSVGVDSATGLNRVTAEPAEEICGPGVPDDYYFQTTGPAASYDLSTTAKIQTLNDENELVTVTWAQFKASDIGMYGGYYGIDEGNTGLITVIDQYFHP